MRFPAPAIAFMRDLQRNNDREWFNPRKDRYKAAHADVEAFAKTVFDAVALDDALAPGKKGVSRIYRDTRFSKDKTPYKPFWGGGLERLGAERRGGYYWHVEPGGLRYFDDVDAPAGAEAFCGGGFWAPERGDLARLRAEIDADAQALRDVLAHPTTAAVFPDGLHRGQTLKTAPKGYARDHPAVDLLRHKSFTLIRTFTGREVAAADFSDEIARTFRAMRPFLDYMTAVLTTDGNGAPLA